MSDLGIPGERSKGMPTWALLDPERATVMLLVPADGLDKSDLDQMLPGRDLPGYLPAFGERAVYCGSGGPLDMGWCNIESHPDLDANEWLVFPTGKLDCADAPSNAWYEALRQAGDLVVCAYSDIFLAAFFGNGEDLSGRLFERFIETSRLAKMRAVYIE